MRPIRTALLALALAPLFPAAASFAGLPPPPGVNGQFYFVDKTSFDKHESVTEIDQNANEFCLGGIIRQIDATTTLNRRVTIQYAALGTIADADDDKVTGDFVGVPVQVTLTVTELWPAAAGGPVDIFGPSTITPVCELRGRVLKAGLEDRATLSCDVGVNYVDFGVPDPATDETGIAATLTAATLNKKNLKVDLKKGILAFKHNGVESPEGIVSLAVCGLGGGGNED